MKHITSQDIKVLSSQTDMNCEMGLMQTLSIVQDNMCDYFKDLKCDGPHLIPECGCFYVLTKTKIHMDECAKWGDVFNISTGLHDLSKIAVTVSSNLKNNNDKIFAKCYQELCAMDVSSRRLRMVGTTPFPTDLEMTGNRDKVFEKFNIEYGESDLIDSIKIKSTNIDIYHHTNNVEYVRFMLATLDKEFFMQNKITDFEIHYSAESKYGDVLRIFKKEIGDEIFFELRRENNKVTTKAKLKFTKR